MPRIITEQFSTFYDRNTRLQFSPVLDRRSGCFVGMADVDHETAAAFEGRPAFREIDDAEYLAMTTIPRPAPKAEPVTGDPLADQRAEVPTPKAATSASGAGNRPTPNAQPALTEPPKPPRSK